MELINLKADTWYYLYASKKGDLYISDEAPVKLNEKERGWYHPIHKYRCLPPPIIIHEPSSSNNIEDFALAIPFLAGEISK